MARNTVYQVSAPATLEQEETWKYGAPLTETQRGRIAELWREDQERKRKEELRQRDIARYRRGQLDAASARLRYIDPLTTAATMTGPGMATIIAGEMVKAGRQMRETGEMDMSAFVLPAALTAVTRGKVKEPIPGARPTRVRVPAEGSFPWQRRLLRGDGGIEGTIVRNRQRTGALGDDYAFSDRGAVSPEVAKGKKSTVEYYKTRQETAGRNEREYALEQLELAQLEARSRNIRWNRELKEVQKTVDKNIDAAWDEARNSGTPGYAESPVPEPPKVVPGDVGETLRNLEVSGAPAEAAKPSSLLGAAGRAAKAVGRGMWNHKTATVAAATAAAVDYSVRRLAKKAEAKAAKEAEEAQVIQDNVEALHNFAGDPTFFSPEVYQKALSSGEAFYGHLKNTGQRLAELYDKAATSGNYRQLREEIGQMVGQMEEELIKTDAARYRYFNESLQTYGSNPLHEGLDFYMDATDARRRASIQLPKAWKKEDK